jgi:3-hydroxypropanoate dehydrogenase
LKKYDLSTLGVFASRVFVNAGNIKGTLMGKPLDKQALDTVFLEARTHRRWQNKPVTDDLLKRLYDVLSMAPTSMNSLPARFVFVKSQAAKDKLKPALDAGNVEQTMAAPATVIVAYDRQFYDYLPETFPHYKNARATFADNSALADVTALRNGSLQGAYLIIAARALGLDCGPMSGFDNAVVDRAFFPDGRWQSNFLVNLGFADPAGLRPRGPRLSFEQACRIV